MPRGASSTACLLAFGFLLRRPAWGSPPLEVDSGHGTANPGGDGGDWDSPNETFRRMVVLTLRAMRPLSGRPILQTPALRIACDPRRRPLAPRRAPSARAANFGKDEVLGSFVDLANFVSTEGVAKKLNAFEDLAYKLGGEVYVDINGWHLYVKDIKVGGSSTVKMHNVLAQQIGEKVLASGRVDDAEVKAIMKAIPLSLGGGAVQVSLLDSIGKTCMYDLTRAIEDWMDDR